MAFGAGPAGPEPSGSRASSPAGQWSPPPAEELQRLLPQYEINGLIGRGGMGAVYKARQGHLDRDVAIKLLPEGLSREADGPLHEARFEQEARAMARMDHSAIVPVYDFGRTERGDLFFVMQHVEGTDLCHHLKQRGGRLPQAEALAIVLQVLDALDCAHGQGIVHRDIKPGNVLINREGRVKIADFGLAKRFDDGARPGETALTMSRVAVGTPDFVAPEVLEGTETPDHRVDLYAVGVMLYQLLTGRVPRGAFEPPSGLASGIDPRLDAIVARAMAANPDRRHHSAAELRGELAALSGGDVATGISPGEGSTASIRRRPEGRRPSRRVTIGLTALLLAGAGASAWLGWKPVSGGGADRWIAASETHLPVASKEAPFVNSLGMKFVPVPGTDVLFCMHETRWRDYAAFARENPGIEIAKKSDDHPAWKVRWEDARQFCEWLSRKEGKTYRLPADEEWSLAVGLGGKERRSPGDTPASLSLRIQEYPWGAALPPPAGAGNFSDQSRRAATLPGSNPAQPYLENYDDGFPGTSPVMSFTPNEFGLHDLAGNVWEWVGDLVEGKPDRRILRGGSFADPPQFSSYRYGYDPAKYNEVVGFRVVLAAGAVVPGNILPPAPPAPVKPAAATKDEPFVNSLDMKFVPVPDTPVLFCIHETRYRDYSAYAAENPGVDGLTKVQVHYGVVIEDRPGDHPVTNASWDDAKQFCAWLSRKEGRVYRLPTDEEWSLAAGLGGKEERLPGDTPETLSGKIQGVYPWGTQRSPPPGAGNYHDLRSRAAQVPSASPNGLSAGDYDDGFPTTAPVMSFSRNEFGLYDLGGNVWEWVEDWFNEKRELRVRRGGSWVDPAHHLPLSSFRYGKPASERYHANGFRIVLELSPENP